jgi:hypothetical protein
MVKIKGKYEFVDFKKAQALHARRGRLTIYLTYSVIGIMAIVTLVGIMFAISGEWPWAYVEIPALIIGAYVVFNFILFPSQLKRVFMQQKDLSAPFEMELTDNAFSLENELGASRLPWNTCVKWKEDRDMLLLYRSDVSFHMLPKRLLHDAGELQYIHEKIQEYKVPEAGKVRNPTQMIIVVALTVLAVIVALVSFLRH